MAKAGTVVGLDVHAAKVVAAILDAETGELRFQRLGESGPVVKLLSLLEAPIRASYEAGPTGYGLARALEVAGVECVVAAPGKIPRGATEKVKTDRRDAEHLVRLPRRGAGPRVAGLPLREEKPEQAGFAPPFRPSPALKSGPARGAPSWCRRETGSAPSD
jgi:transposase